MRAVSDHLRSHTPASLAARFADLPLPIELARRVVLRAVHQDRDDLEGVRGLSKALAARVAERSRFTRLEVIDRRRSAVDPFVKYLFRAPDGRSFEARVDEPKGDPGNTLGRPELEDKAQRLAKFGNAASEAEMRSAFAAIWSLVDCARIGRLLPAAA